jgi:hypothetical protein
MKPWCALPFGASLVLCARLALADDDVTTLLARGIELRTERRDAEALALFRKAYALEPSPRALAQIGMAEQALGDWVAAGTDLDAVLDARSDPWVAQNLAAVHAAVDGVRQHLGSILVRTTAPNATLWIDGKSRGRLPLPSPVRAPVGDVTIAVRAEGYESFEERVVLTAGATWDQWVALRPMSDAPPAAPVPHVVPGAQNAGTMPLPAAQARPAGGELGWALVVTGGVLAAGGATAHALAASNASIYNDDGRCLTGALSRDERCGSYKATAQTLFGVAVVSYGLAAASGATGLVMLLTSGRSKAGRGSGTACGPTAGFWGLSCQGRF